MQRSKLLLKALAPSGWGRKCFLPIIFKQWGMVLMIYNQIINFFLIMIMISTFFIFEKFECTVEYFNEKKKTSFSLKQISILLMLISLIYSLRKGSYIFVYIFGLEMLFKLVILFVKKRWEEFIYVLMKTIIYILLLFLCNEIIFIFINIVLN